MGDERTETTEPLYESPATQLAWDARAYLRDLQDLDGDDPQREYIADQANLKLTELFELTEPDLVGALFLEVPFPDTRDEVLAEMRRRIINGLPKFEGNAKYETWAHRIMLNTSATALKDRSRRLARQARKFTETRLEEALEDRTSLSPEEQVLEDEEQALEAERQAQMQHQVEELLGHLSENNRRTMVLRFLHNLSYAEIAHQLGDGSVEAPRVRVHRSLKLLRKIVHSQEITEE